MVSSFLLISNSFLIFIFFFWFPYFSNSLLASCCTLLLSSLGITKGFPLLFKFPSTPINSFKLREIFFLLFDKLSFLFSLSKNSFFISAFNSSELISELSDFSQILSNSNLFCYELNKSIWISKFWNSSSNISIILFCFSILGSKRLISFISVFLFLCFFGLGEFFLFCLYFVFIFLSFLF